MADPKPRVLIVDDERSNINILGNLLVAEFDNWVPPVSRLYWRGPVLWRFDGRRWLPSSHFGERSQMMREGFRNARQWSREWRSQGTEVGYALRLRGHGKNWMYALDLPGGGVTESYLTRDYQLMSMTPLREETRFHTTARFDARIGSAISEDQRREGLDFPAGANPRLEALGRQLASAQHGNARAVAVEALDFFARGQFRYNDHATLPPDTEHPYDHFLFTQREGGPDLLAASYVLLLRAAGVPARLVTGFRGGRLMALTDFVLVKESNAHAWAEVWIEDDGWVRFDPTDVVAPQRFAETKKPVARAAAPTLEETPKAAPAAAQRERPEPGPKDGNHWLDSLDKWVIHYDASRQSELLALPEDGTRGWAWLAAALVATLAALFALYRGGALLRRRLREDPVARAWRHLRRELARGGITTADTDCPLALARRLETHTDGALAAELLRRYAELRYGQADPLRAKRFTTAAHHFRFTPGNTTS